MSVRAIMTAIVGLGLAAGPSRAGVIYSTGFEDPPFAAGSQLVGQDGWVAPAFLSPTGATISTAAPAGGLQGVRVHGADLTPDPIVNGAGFDAVGSYRRVVNYDAGAAGTPVVRVEAAVRLDGPQTAQTTPRAAGDFVSANLALSTADGVIGELSLSADGHVYAYGPVTPYLFGVPYALGQYQTLAVEVNFATEEVGFYLNGALLGTESFAGAGFTSQVVTRGAVLLYANLPANAPPGVARDDYTGYYDDFSISAQTVPEPVSAALLAAGGAGLLARGRGRRLRG